MINTHYTYFFIVHVCNLKEFKVYAGPNLNNLHLLLHTGLNNDTVPESFPPDYSLSGLPDKLPFPVQYVKIVPLAAWGSNFNFSIWYMELRGWDSAVDSSTSAQLVKATLDEYNRSKEQQTTRLILKFLRQHNHQAAFTALHTSSGVQLEAPVVTELHNFITQNRFKEAEKLLIDLFNHDSTIFDQYLHDHVPYQVEWTRLYPKRQFNPSQSASLDENGDYRMSDANAPSPRGGHQLLWDPNGQQLFLLGGWDGKRDLADFWSFNIQSNTWTLLSMNVEKEGGPSARSCHKAVLHCSSGDIYVLGRYIDSERRDSSTVPCDFYRFNCISRQWTRLSADVRAEGGPGCIYDHQMVVDEEEECIWVFGGRLLSGTNESSVYSGLYKFDLKSLQWALISTDPSADPSNSASGMSAGNNTTTATATANISDTTNNLPPVRVPSRIGHSMLFDSQSRTLLILGGQRYKDQLADFYKFSTDRSAVTQLWKNLQMIGGPDSGFTQRATFDPLSREMFVFSSLIRNGQPVVGVTPQENNNQEHLNAAVNDQCAFWCFDLDTDKWTRINTTIGVSNQNKLERPQARFAHQIVYDCQSKTHFLFGGNPGIPSDPSARLDDLWSAKFSKSQGPRDILRHCQYLIRKAMFEVMTTGATADISSALKFLQTDLAAVVNHSDQEESASFRSLSAKLFLKSTSVHPVDQSIFEEIVKYLPKAMQPPPNSL